MTFLRFFLLPLVRLDRHARPHHQRQGAPKVLQAAAEFGRKGRGLPPAVGTAISEQGTVPQQMYCCLVCSFAGAWSCLSNF